VIKYKKIIRIWYQLKGKALHFMLTSAVRFVNLITYKNLRKPEPFYGNYILGVGLIPTPNANFFKFDRAWNKSYSTFNIGEYKESIKIREEIMREIYDINGITEPGYFPPILSKSFSGAIGHLGHIGVHIAAQKLGLVPPGQRYMQVSKKDLSKPFFLSVKERIKPLSFSYLHNSDEPPGQWHIFERMQLVKTTDGFLDLHQLIEKVFTASDDIFNEPILKLDPEYIMNSMLELKKYGLKESDWFVTLHVRDSGNSNEHNSQSIDNYIKSIDYIIGLGGKVIRIGDSAMQRLPTKAGLIDLTQNSLTSSHLHLYALAAAKFFIGTTSGPKVIPPLFKVPMLVTNMTVLGIESIYYSGKTLFIPKKTFMNSKLLSFSEIINSPVGFASFSPRNILEKKILFESNSEDEILNGVKEMIDIVFNNLHSRNYELDNKAKLIRSNVEFATSGLFSASWLESNHSWFLSKF
jgi:putative glycosyltransferase (TIGR04372 family)